VFGENRPLKIERACVRPLDCFGHGRVEQPALGLEKAVVHHLAEAIVREVKLIAALVQDAPANQLLDGIRQLTQIFGLNAAQLFGVDVNAKAVHPECGFRLRGEDIRLIVDAPPRLTLLESSVGRRQLREDLA
jgi:hypothetical protein